MLAIGVAIQPEELADMSYCKKFEESDNLSLPSEHRVRHFYERAYLECRIITSHTFPPPRTMQGLVQAWEQLRKWCRP